MNRTLLALALTFGLIGTGRSALADDKVKEDVKIETKDGHDKYKEKTKVRDKPGKIHEDTKIKSKDETGKYEEKTKVRSKHGETVTETKVKEK